MITTKNNIIWDIFIRIFHWTLVVAFIISYLTEGEVYLHFYSGWYILILLGCRVVWGFIGTKHARFIDFIKAPTEIINYAKSLKSNDVTIKHYDGHNPLGGLMVVAMLCFLTLTCITGVLLYSDDGNSAFSFTNYSPLASVEEENDHKAITNSELSEHNKHEKDEDDEFLKEVHDLLANFTILLILLHIAGVVYSSRLHQENLIKAMFTGKKSPLIDKDSKK